MRRALAIALVATLAACGSGSGPSAKSTPTPVVTTASPTPTLAPTHRLLTLREAKARYLVLVKPSNAAITALNKAVHARPQDWRKIRDATATLAIRERAFQVGLLNGLWPVKIAPTAQHLAEALANETVYLRRAGRAKTRSDFTNAWEDYQAADTSDVNKYVELMRTQLGLPPAD